MLIQAMLGSALLGFTAVLAAAQTVVVDFNDQEPGKAPRGFSIALTGKGQPGIWIVQADEKEASRGKVLAQTSMDNTSYRFPLCIYDAFSAKNVDVSTKFKAVKGEEDRAAGIVWRYKDKDNYYIMRANAREDNVVLYKVEKGKRTDLPLKGQGRTYGQKVKVPSDVWGTLRVVAKWNTFEAYLNGRKLYEVEDTTFPDAGKVGLWTKADSYTLFDDLSITELK